MSLPVPPDVETILRNSITTLRDIVAPDTREEWARWNAALLVGALEYALALLGDDRAGRHRADLRAALERCRPAVERAGESEPVAALDDPSPFEAASRLLVWSQNNPGELAEELRTILHAELYAQLDQELAASEPIMEAFGRGMRGDI
jgi:hypothetical protein